MLEIMLIVAVWKRGWGPRALLPTFFTGAVAFFIGASSPRPDPGVLVVLVLVDLAALVAMLCNPPKASQEPNGTSTELKPLEDGVAVTLVEPYSRKG
jgi:hypothetical protein